MWRRIGEVLVLGVAALASCSDADKAPGGEGAAGGGAAGGGAGGGRAAGDSGVPVPASGDCQAYCAALQTACTGENAAFATTEDCLAACASMPATGAVGDADKDTWHCRAFHAGASAGDPATHCAHAGLSGGGVCGTWCEVYCRLYTQSCGGHDLADVDACLGACEAMPQDGAWNTLAGNNVQCRIGHASVAANDAAHCEHAGVTGGGVCGDDPCEAYCDQTAKSCAGQGGLYPDRGACLATCGAMPKDAPFDASDGDSVQCRTYHAAAAASDAVHCAHAAASGGGVCGDRCAAYCDQVMGHCTGGDALFPDRGACLSVCGTFPVGSEFAAGGDSVQCRLMHASYPAAGDPSHCAHAAPDGGGVCVDEAAPAQIINVSGEVHELGKHLANNHVGVGGATVLALGVVPAASTITAATAGTVGSYTLSLPANGQVIFHVNKPGFYPTYLPATLGSADIAGNHLVATEAAWLDAIARTHGVDLATPFDCHAPGLSAADRCVYTAVFGRIMDDAQRGVPQPVAGVTAAAFQVTGGDAGADWYTMGPYFLNPDGTPSAGNVASTAGGQFVLFAEVPQIAGGNGPQHLHVTAAWDNGGTMRYFGPAHPPAFRPTSVTWTDLAETGIPPAGGGVEAGVSFEGQVYPLLLPVAEGGFGCLGCHTHQAGSSPAGGLNLFGGPDVAYAELDPAAHPARVNTASPEASLLLTKPLYDATGASTHPIFAWVSQNDEAYQLIRQWIVDGGKRGGAARPVSFVDDVVPLLQGQIGCNGCHNGEGLDVTGTPQALWAALVTDAAADQSGTGEAHRVNVARPERSLLLTNPLSGCPEPHPMKPFFSAADPRYQVLYRWISEGALQ